MLMASRCVRVGPPRACASGQGDVARKTARLARPPPPPTPPSPSPNIGCSGTSSERGHTMLLLVGPECRVVPRSPCRCPLAASSSGLVGKECSLACFFFLFGATQTRPLLTPESIWHISSSPASCARNCGHVALCSTSWERAFT